MKFTLGIILILAGFIGVGFIATTFEHPPVEEVQHGYRGTGMVEIYNPAHVAALSAKNEVPKPEDPTPPAGQPSSAVYENVQVLKDLDAQEFMRLMAAITDWVAPNEGCTYCHTDNPAEDKLYTKVVARRMLQMVLKINSDWKTHVDGTGVTCYTCHRGQPVPSNIWFDNPALAQSHGELQEPAGKNAPSSAAALASLPSDPFTPFLVESNNIRVAAEQALPGADRQSIKQTEWTYSLMMHISSSLGVNCTYCHNTRAFSSWEQSSPQRVTAWYGIRMVRDLNDNYLIPLAGTLPSNRLGPMGDGPKLNCATCHQGVYKPLFGVSMLKDYPELGPSVASAEPAAATQPAPQ